MTSEALSTHGHAVAPSSTSWRVTPDELAAAVDAVWHLDTRGACLHPVLSEAGGAVEYFTRCRVDPRLGWLAGRLRATLQTDATRAVWGLVVEPSRPSAAQIVDRAIPWDREHSTWLRLASVTPPPPEPRQLRAGDPFDPAAWEDFIRRQAFAKFRPPPTGAASRAALRRFGLRSRFTLAELKRAYRQHAMAAHPDRGGSARAFVVVREAYERLLPHAEVEG